MSRIASLYKVVTVSNIIIINVVGCVMARFFTKKTILSSCVSLFLPAMCSAITFQEITSEESGITYVGQSWGASWGDFNGDGWPDLWSSNHGGMPTLYINNKNGGFTDIASDQIIPKDIWDILKGYDSHGSAWADFDNDGDQDLVQLADGGIRFQANHLFINTGLGSFEQVDQAVQMGIDQPLANARTPLWFDWNNDGLLDLMAANAMRSVSVNPPTTLFEQQADGFVSVQSLELDLQQPSSFAMLSDLTGNGEKDIILGTGSSAIRVYSNDGTKLTNITTDLNLAQYKTSQDIALADLTGSLKPELYMVRGEVSNGLELVGDFKIESTLNAGKNQKGLSFSTSGQIYIELHPNFKVTVDDVHIGATGSLPASINFSLSPDDPGVVGMPIYTAGVSHGFYIWFDPANQLWTVYFSSPFYADSRNLVIISDSLITNVQPINFDNNELPKPDYMFVDQGGFYSEQAALHVPDVHNSGRSIVVADFDNDMDMDIYIHRSSPVVNLPNRLYENDGNGNYTAVINAGGAEGTLLGRADTVSTADYNQDGFLDIFLTNGKSKAPFEKDGPYQLFKNAGNNNHWIELDLEGLISNRDGIGATVSLMAGGVTQIREQVGGIHRRTQDHARIHFGLGANKIIDEIKIVWPSGVSQSLHNIKADQIMRIHELAAVSVKGKPMYQAGSENMVYVWKQYYDGPYHIRVNGDGLPSAYLLEMISSEAFTNVVGKK